MRDLRILNYNSETSTYSFSLDLNAGPAEGRDRLAQVIAKRLLTLKGSNWTDPEYGENFANLYGLTDINRVTEVKEALPLVIKSISDKIIEEQRTQMGLQKGEKLVNLNLTSAVYEEDTSSWQIEINIITEDGVSSALAL